MARTFPGLKVNEGTGTTLDTVLPGANPAGEIQAISVSDPDDGSHLLAISASGEASVKAGAGAITDLATLNGKLSAARLAAAGLSLPTTHDVLALHMASNGATEDPFINNAQVTLLASAARTVQTDSPLQTNYNAKGVQLFLNVTAASGTGGLTLRVLTIDPVSGNVIFFNVSPTAVTTTNNFTYQVYPGIVGTLGNLTQAVAVALPRIWGVRILVGDASSYTYAVSASYIL